MDAASLALMAKDMTPTPVEIPGATGGRFLIQLLNEDADRGVVTSIIHLPAGGHIPAHLHRAGSEMHYVLDGDLIDAGREFGPGGFLTHAAGTTHGPHESRGGARVLTVQHWQSRDGKFDFHLTGKAAAPPPGGTAAAGLPPDPTAPNLGTGDAEAPTG